MAKRKSLAEREPNGRVQRVVLPPTGEVKRLRDAALAGMRDPSWGTELGRLYLAGKIGTAGFAAGKKWRELAADYSGAMQSPSPDPTAVNFNSGAGHPLDPESYEGRKEARRHQRAAQSFTEAANSLKELSGAVAAVVRRVCERNEALCGHQELLDLIHGLETLCSFWGLTDDRKSSHVR